MRIRLTLVLIVFFFTLIGVVTTAACASAAPTLPDDPELGILFTSNYGDGRGIFWMRPDGSEVEQVFSFADPRIPTDGARRGAVLSPDTSNVMFLFSPQNPLFYRMSLLDFETRNITQLTDDKLFVTDPHWSPDGSKIAYAAGDGFGGEVYVIDVGTGNEWLVSSMYGRTWMGLNEYSGMNWSPDGSRLALEYLIDEERRGYFGIFTVNVDGSDLRLVSQQGESANAPVWDTSGSILYYGCTAFAHGLTAICLMDVNRGLSGRLADMADFIPEQEILETIILSPDGQIAFTHSSYFGPSDQIFVFNPESGDVNALTANNMVESLLRWSHRPHIP